MKYYSDGFMFIRNPSPIGGGYTIVDEYNLVVAREKIYKAGLTVNESELLGVYNCLKIAKNKDIISTDSKNTINWIFGCSKKLKKKRARKDLDNIKKESYNLIINKNIKLIWESREKNLAGIYNEETRTEPDLSRIV